MRFKLLIGSTALLLALAVGLVVAWREPEYGGRTLSSWLEELDLGQTRYDFSKKLDAEDAVNRIGGRGVPTLIKMIRYRDSFYREPWQVRFKKFLAKQKIIKIKPPPPAQRPSVESIQWRGAKGVWILGPKADTAIPDLVPLLTNQSASLRAVAARALGAIGTNAGWTTPLLTKALKDPNVEVRVCARMGLQGIGPAARDALPELRRLLNETNNDMRMGAMEAFLAITNGSPELLPYLVRELGGTNFLRGWAVSMLRSYGYKAQPVVPELTRLLDDPDRNVRRAVTNALNTIRSNELPYARTQKTSFSFGKMSSDKVLDFYAHLTGKHLETGPEVQSFATVTIQPYGLRTAEEGARWIEEDLSEQANLVLVPSKNGVVLVRSKQSGQ